MSEFAPLEIETRLGLRVRVSAGRWQLIVAEKHPVMFEREDDVARTLSDPDEIRQSSSDRSVYLFYKLERPARWICAVVKDVDGRDAFLITAYPTDAIKEGARVWMR